MRGTIEGLRSPHPLALGLPAIYLEEDPFTVRLTEAFDDVLAPVFATLDNLPAYFDPSLTPPDFLGWLASWVALELDETWDLGRRRQAVKSGVDLLRRRGTAVGLADELRLATGAEIEVLENGGTAWSLDPGSSMVGTPDPALLVRVMTADAGAVDLDRVERIISAAKPAHVPHKVEVVAQAAAKRSRSKASDATAVGDSATDKPPEPEPAA
jgi:phage tail-like protein